MHSWHYNLERPARDIATQRAASLLRDPAVSARELELVGSPGHDAILDHLSVRRSRQDSLEGVRRNDLQSGLKQRPGAVRATHQLNGRQGRVHRPRQAYGELFDVQDARTPPAPGFTQTDQDAHLRQSERCVSSDDPDWFGSPICRNPSQDQRAAAARVSVQSRWKSPLVGRLLPRYLPVPGEPTRALCAPRSGETLTWPRAELPTPPGAETAHELLGSARYSVKWPEPH